MLRPQREFADPFDLIPTNRAQALVKPRVAQSEAAESLINLIPIQSGRTSSSNGIEIQPRGAAAIGHRFGRETTQELVGSRGKFAFPAGIFFRQSSSDHLRRGLDRKAFHPQDVEHSERLAISSLRNSVMSH